MTKEEKRVIDLRLNGFIQFILNMVDDEGSWEVQKRLHEIERLYWECFDHYE